MTIRECGAKLLATRPLLHDHVVVAEADLFRALFDGALDAVVVSDLEGTIVAANPAVESLLGHPPASLIGKPVDMLVPSRFAGHAAHRERYTASPSPRAMGRGKTLYALHADGSEVAVDISLNVIDDGGRRLVASAMRDLRGRSYVPESIRVQAVALRSAANGVVITDRDGVITWANPAVCAMTGYSAQELIGQHTRILKSGVHDEAYYRQLWSTISAGETWSGTIVNRRKDGTHYHEEQTIAPVVDEQGQVSHFIAIKQDVTRQYQLQQELLKAKRELEARLGENERLNRLLEERAIRDPLTGAYNRHFFDQAFAGVADGPVAVALLDLDHFKGINDLHGHAAGDEALRRVAQVLRWGTRKSDVVCRLGGDEFLVILDGAAEETALARAEQWMLRLRGEAVEISEGRSFAVSASIGVAVGETGEAMEATIRRADRALYAAKNGGRDRVVLAGAPTAVISPN